MKSTLKTNKVRKLKRTIVSFLFKLILLTNNNWFLKNMSTLILDYLSPLLGFSDVTTVCCLLLLFGTKYIIILLLILINNPPHETP